MSSPVPWARFIRMFVLGGMALASCSDAPTPREREGDLAIAVRQNGAKLAVLLRNEGKTPLNVREVVPGGNLFCQSKSGWFGAFNHCFPAGSTEIGRRVSLPPGSQREWQVELPVAEGTHRVFCEYIESTEQDRDMWSGHLISPVTDFMSPP